MTKICCFFDFNQMIKSHAPNLSKQERNQLIKLLELKHLSLHQRKHTNNCEKCHNNALTRFIKNQTR